jgi:hypothetical protein
VSGIHVLLLQLEDPSLYESDKPGKVVREFSILRLTDDPLNFFYSIMDY